MLKSRLAIAAATSTLVLAGCQYFSGSEAVAPKAPSAADAPISVLAPQIDSETRKETDVTEPAEACDVLDSRDWSAWINRMPGPGAVPTVHVSGKVDVRTGGYTFEWQEGPMDRSAVPALRLKLVAKAPDGMATQAITTQEVKYEAPALGMGYSRVIMGCGGTTLAEITDIMDVQ